MIVVTDTSPINYLILIGQVNLLRDLFQHVVMPQAVLKELQHSKTPAPVRMWASRLPQWVELRSASHVEIARGLGPGELEAMAIADEIKADFVLIDDRDARKFAFARGLTTIGTVGVLEKAGAKGIVDLPRALQELRDHTTCYITDSLIKSVLARARRQ